MTEDAIHIDIDPNDEKLKALDYRQFQEKLPLVFKIQKYEIPSDKENIIYNIPDYSDMNALFEGLRKYCSNIEMKKPKKQIDIPNITPFPPPKERIQELFSQSDTFDNIKYSDQIKQDIQSEETEIRETHKTSLKERKIMFASGIKIVEKMTTYESNSLEIIEPVLLQHRTFMTSEDLFKLLILRLEQLFDQDNFVYSQIASKGKVSELISPNPPPPQPLLLTGIQPLRQIQFVSQPINSRMSIQQIKFTPTFPLKQQNQTFIRPISFNQVNINNSSLKQSPFQSNQLQINKEQQHQQLKRENSSPMLQQLTDEQKITSSSQIESQCSDQSSESITQNRVSLKKPLFGITSKLTASSIFGNQQLQTHHSFGGQQTSADLINQKKAKQQSTFHTAPIPPTQRVELPNISHLNQRSMTITGNDQHRDKDDKQQLIQNAMKKAQRQSAANAICKWIKDYPTDFISETMQNLIDIIFDIFSQSDEHKDKIRIIKKSLQDTLIISIPLTEEQHYQQLYEQQMDSLMPKLSKEKQFPIPILPEIFKQFLLDPTFYSCEIQLLQFDPREIARQLTLLESGMCRSIQNIELVDTAWMTKKNVIIGKQKRIKVESFNDPITGELIRKEEEIEDDIIKVESLTQFAPHVHEIIQHTNAMMKWIPTCILSGQDIDRQAEIVTYFLDVGQELLNLHNYQGIFEIGLGMTWDRQITNQTQMLKKLDRNHISKWNEIKEMTTLKGGGYKGIKDLSEKAESPYIPIIPEILKHLAKVDISGNIVDGLANIGKARSIWNIISRLRYSLTRPYNYAPVPQIQSFLRSLAERSCMGDTKAGQ